MKKIQTIDKNPDGLHQKYFIQKIVGYKEKQIELYGKIYGVMREAIIEDVSKKAEYFVLRLDLKGKDPNHIFACRKAIQVYANEIEATIPQLAKDLRERYPVEALANLLKP